MVDLPFAVLHARGAFAHAESFANEFVRAFRIRRVELANEGIDRVFLEALQFLESLDGRLASIDDEGGDALSGGGAGDIRVKAFAAFDEVGKNFDWSLSGVGIDLRRDRRGRAVFDGNIARRAELRAEF
jgi:hypothetical protein